MAHKTSINGTAYEVKGGKALINGTAYEIKGGKTLVGGTAYKIGFGPVFTPIVNFGTVTFGYSTILTHYSAKTKLDSLPSNIREINAVSINGNIIELPYGNVTTGVVNVWRNNYSASSMFPSNAGEISVGWAENPTSLPYAITTYAYEDMGTCEVIAGKYES